MANKCAFCGSDSKEYELCFECYINLAEPGYIKKCYCGKWYVFNQEM